MCCRQVDLCYLTIIETTGRKLVRSEVSAVLVSIINGYNDSTDIANEFASKYNVLYNSVTSDPTDMQSMALSIRRDIITTSEGTDHSFPHVITMLDIKFAVKKLRA